MTIFKSSTVFSLFLPVSTVANMIYHIICITYMALSSREESLFQNKKFINHTFFLLSSYFHTHPITLLLEILGGRIHGPCSTSNFEGPSPQFSTSLRPRTTPLVRDTPSIHARCL